MLEEVSPKIPDLSKIESVDTLLAPMLKAAREGKRLEAPLLEIIRTLGFDSFIFAIATEPRPSRDSRAYVWTSVPREWVEAYEKNAYIEIDPRDLGAWTNVALRAVGTPRRSRSTPGAVHASTPPSLASAAAW